MERKYNQIFSKLVNITDLGLVFDEYFSLDFNQINFGIGQSLECLRLHCRQELDAADFARHFPHRAFLKRVLKEAKNLAIIIDKSSILPGLLLELRQDKGLAQIKEIATVPGKTLEKVLNRTFHHLVSLTRFTFLISGANSRNVFDVQMILDKYRHILTYLALCYDASATDGRDLILESMDQLEVLSTNFIIDSILIMM